MAAVRVKFPTAEADCDEILTPLPAPTSDGAAQARDSCNRNPVLVLLTASLVLFRVLKPRLRTLPSKGP